MVHTCAVPVIRARLTACFRCVGSVARARGKIERICFDVNEAIPATLQLGFTTATYDLEGEVMGRSPVNITYEEFEEALKDFVGEFEQKPPAYSAIKIGGKKAYDLARKGEEVDLEPRMISVTSIDLLDWNPPEAMIDVECSSGTYIRSLVYDLGEKLGCGATLTALRRTRNGQFTMREAIPLRKLQEAFVNGDWYKYLIPAAEALSDWIPSNLTKKRLTKSDMATAFSR